MPCALSYHFPIECELRLPFVTCDTPHCSGTPLSRRRWNPHAKDAYCHALQSPTCAAELQTARQSAIDRDVGAAFQHVLNAVGQAADDAGMLSKRASHKVAASFNKPFFDTECRVAKRRVNSARDPISWKLLEREYHSLVRSKRRAFRLGRLQALLEQ